jgi:hypothetical protein
LGFPFTTYVLEVYLVPNILAHAFHMHLLKAITTLCGEPMQVVGLQVVVARR